MYMLNNPTFLNSLFHVKRILNIMNKFLPLYKDIKPITSKIPELMDKLHNMNNSIIKRRDEFINYDKNNVKETNNNEPKFFL